MGARVGGAVRRASADHDAKQRRSWGSCPSFHIPNQPRLLSVRREQCDTVSNNQLAAAIGRRMPIAAQAAWRLLARYQITGHDEVAALPAARFLAQHGEGLGVRAPNIQERSRAMGFAEYMDTLGLDEEE